MYIKGTHLRLKTGYNTNKWWCEINNENMKLDHNKITSTIHIYMHPKHLAVSQKNSRHADPLYTSIQKQKLQNNKVLKIASLCSYTITVKNISIHQCNEWTVSRTAVFSSTFVRKQKKHE